MEYFVRKGYLTLLEKAANNNTPSLHELYPELSVLNDQELEEAQQNLMAYPELVVQLQDRLYRETRERKGQERLEE